MRAAVQLAYGDTEARCPKCRGAGSDHLRGLWGCDKRAGAPVFARTCPRCSGYNNECTLCNGSGTEQVFRCAPSQIDANVADAFRAYNMLERGHMPQSGGARAQSAIFMDVVSLIDSERAAIDEEERKSRERKGAKG